MAYDEQLAGRVEAYLKGMPMMESKKMFGGVAYLLQGNMACGVHKDFLMVRVDPEEYDAALEEPHVRVFDLTRRPMRGWVLVEPDGMESEAELGAWIERGLAYARSLPPK